MNTLSDKASNSRFVHSDALQPLGCSVPRWAQLYRWAASKRAIVTEKGDKAAIALSKYAGQWNVSGVSSKKKNTLIFFISKNYASCGDLFGSVRRVSSSPQRLSLVNVAGSNSSSEAQVPRLAESCSLGCLPLAGEVAVRRLGTALLMEY